MWMCISVLSPDRHLYTSLYYGASLSESAILPAHSAGGRRETKHWAVTLVKTWPLSRLIYSGLQWSYSFWKSQLMHVSTGMGSWVYGLKTHLSHFIVKRKTMSELGLPREEECMSECWVWMSAAGISNWIEKTQTLVLWNLSIFILKKKKKEEEWPYLLQGVQNY